MLQHTRRAVAAAGGRPGPSANPPSAQAPPHTCAGHAASRPPPTLHPPPLRPAFPGAAAGAPAH